MGLEVTKTKALRSPGARIPPILSRKQQPRFVRRAAAGFGAALHGACATQRAAYGVRGAVREWGVRRAAWREACGANCVRLQVRLGPRGARNFMPQLP